MKRRNWGTLGFFLAMLCLMGNTAPGESTGRVDRTVPKAQQGAKASEERKDSGQALLRAVRLERAHLRKQQEAMAAEEIRLAEVRREIDGRIEEMERLRERLENEVKRLQAEQERMSAEREAELLRLVKMYEAMSPEEAAPLVEGLDEKVVGELLSRMKEKKAGQILEFVREEKAVALTEYLARRKKVKQTVVP
ncbi:MAG: hypothetical protein R3231_09980 [bacterium]|nr:hypothetical protein [bacterium]